MRNEIRPIDHTLLNDVVQKNRAKEVTVRIENGQKIKVYEAKNAYGALSAKDFIVGTDDNSRLRRIRI